MKDSFSDQLDACAVIKQAVRDHPQETAELLGAEFLLVNEAYLESIKCIATLNQPSMKEEIWRAINLTIPVRTEHRLIRIGGTGDGAYLVPDDLRAVEACFSPGVSTQIDFEQELAETFKIPSFMCDYSVDPEDLKLIQGMHHFQKKWLGAVDSKTTCRLDSWINESVPSPSADLLLQMDIEWAEYRALLAASISTLERFRIIVLELHHLDWLGSYFFTNTLFIPVLQKLSVSFYCVHAHANNCCGVWQFDGVDVPAVIELTFHRKERCTHVGHHALIPHPLDIINDQTKQDLVLGFPWRGNCASGLGRPSPEVLPR